MKKFLCTLLATMLATLTMTAMAVIPPPVDPPVIVTPKNYFTITNKNSPSSEPLKIEVDKFTTWVDGNPSYTVNLDGGVYKSEDIEITYHNVTFLGTPYLTWYYGWNANDAGALAPLTYKGTGSTQVFKTENMPSRASMLIVKCNYQTSEQSSETKPYIMYINVINRNRITVKNTNASEVQVSYTNQEDAAAYAGKRATTALYDIYGNKVSGGYLDAFGTSTLSTKGKPGYYIVKVMVDNRVVFTETLQVK